MTTLLIVSLRGLMLKVVTEITVENMKYCEAMMKFAELRHIDGIGGNFCITETEYVAFAATQQPTAENLLQQREKNDTSAEIYL